MLKRIMQLKPSTFYACRLQGNKNIWVKISIKSYKQTKQQISKCFLVLPTSPIDTVKPLVGIAYLFDVQTAILK